MATLMAKKPKTRTIRIPVGEEVEKANRANRRPNAPASQETLIRQAIIRYGSLPNWKVAKKISGASSGDVAGEREALQKIGVTARLRIFTVEQAAALLGVTPRRVRAICQEGRLGTRLGLRAYAISREELLEFAERDRPCGTPGQQQKAEELAEATEEG